jgi:FkbM family methyltransferase
VREKSPVQLDLIYDVGMHNGDDTAFYLAQGFRVLGIEADPELFQQCRARFAKEIESTRLTILNVGISDKNEIKKFWICETNRAWNSFHESVAGRDGCAHHFIEIPTQRFDDILRRFGTPTYLKIDIEGNDLLCLDALKSAALPNFMSAEEQEVEVHTGRPAVLNRMHGLGYRCFKLVSQFDFRTLCSWRRPKLIDRVINSASSGRLRAPGLSGIADYFTYESKLARRNGGYRFRFGSSGPWGEGVPGKWVGFEEACECYIDRRTQHFTGAVKDYSFWCDWHAKLL